MQPLRCGLLSLPDDAMPSLLRETAYDVCALQGSMSRACLQAILAGTSAPTVAAAISAASVDTKVAPASAPQLAAQVTGGKTSAVADSLAKSTGGKNYACILLKVPFRTVKLHLLVLRVMSQCI